ncbi:hypothetical protein [Sphingobacterium paramultivorum]|uniref:hypothetical protein n=1 Tax=Sphingobacterium paramultivorum TaxID=2886510 RepID=UPI00129C9671|nr:hypothetical protein [Sphingobacterium paramultivorum]
MEKKIRSDKVSEKYRKYINKILLPGNKYCYILWGTDLDNEDFDYLLLNENKEIIAFKKIKDLLSFVKNTTIDIPDARRMKRWGELYKSNRSYSTYDLRFLLEILIEDYDAEFYVKEKSRALEIIDFYNLFSDYSNQSVNRKMLKLQKNKNLNLFIDYLYMYCFWSKPKETYEQRLRTKVENINFNELIRILKEMIFLFTNQIKIN